MNLWSAIFFVKNLIYLCSNCLFLTCFDSVPQVLDRENQMDNPCSGWLGDVAWDNITELEKLTNFHGVITSFEQYPRDWNIWYTSAQPEVAPLPGQNCLSVSLYSFVPVSQFYVMKKERCLILVFEKDVNNHFQIIQTLNWTLGFSHFKLIVMQS